ncbi:MAG: hypothetical protein FJ304_04605 [Planctomycetes bacterium]|nr:hypothetical protein [Planctomycetota bacterium]
MGNPASVIRKKTEKRRKKYETRLGAGAYLPKEQRLAVNAEVAKLEAAAKVESEKHKAERAAKKKAKKAAPAPAAPAPKDEKK